MAAIRTKFISDVKKMSPQMTNFSTENIMNYCVSMKDKLLHEITANFISNLFRQYKIEDNLPPLKILCLRYMGKIRRPQGQTRRTKL